jgi:hypothetical protein
VFPGDRDADANDLLLLAETNRRFERGNWGVRADLARETLVRTELPGTDVEEPELGESVGGDSGQVFLRNRRTRATLNPNAAWRLAERQRIDADARYEYVEFSSARSGEFTDYEDLSARIRLGYDLTPRSTLWVRASAIWYRPDVGVDSDTQGISVELTSQPSERLSVFARGGVERTRLEVLPGENANPTSAVVGAGGDWRLQSSRLFFDYIRGVNANSTGVLVERDQIRLRYLHDLSPRLSARVSVVGVKTDGLDADRRFDSARRYARSTFGFEWRIRREWSLTGGYDYTWQKYDRADSSAASNGINLSIVYEPRRR